MDSFDDSLHDFYQAIRNGQIENIRKLLNGPGRNRLLKEPFDNYFPLHTAIDSGKTESIIFLLMEGCSPSQLSLDGKHPLHMLVHSSKLTLNDDVRKILDLFYHNGVCFTERDGDGNQLNPWLSNNKANAKNIIKYWLDLGGIEVAMVNHIRGRDGLFDKPLDIDMAYEFGKALSGENITDKDIVTHLRNWNRGKWYVACNQTIYLSLNNAKDLHDDIPF